MVAAQNRDERVARILLEAGAKVNAQIDSLGGSGLTPLHVACNRLDNSGVIQVLLQAGADPNLRSHDGTTALFGAIRFQQEPALLQTLLEAGADVNASCDNGETPLMYAARFYDRPYVLRLLLEAGADPAARNANGWTALDYAEQNATLRESKTVDLLREATEAAEAQ